MSNLSNLPNQTLTSESKRRKTLGATLDLGRYILPMSSQDEKEILLNVVLQLAKKLLEDEGSVRPFGGALRANRVVTVIRPRRIKRDATLEELDKYWARELRRVVDEKGCNIVCFCAEVLVLSNNGTPVAAVLVRIEQNESLSEELIYPYRKYIDSGVSFESPTVTHVQHRVFNTQSPG